MPGDKRVSSLLHSNGALDAELTALIGACALDPSKWQSVLDRLSGSIGGLRTQMLGFDFETGTDLGLLYQGYAADAIDDYLNHYGASNVWMPGFIRHGAGVTVPSQAMATPEEVQGSAFYHEWVKPQEDVTAGGGVILFKDQNRMVALGGNIPSHLGARLQPQFLAVLDQISGPMQQAFEVNRALAGLSLEKYVAGQAASQINAIILLSPSGRLLYCNRVAEELIEVGTLMKMGFSRRPQFADPVAQTCLDEALYRLSSRSPRTFPVHACTLGQSFTARLLSIQSDALDYSPFGTLVGLDEPAFLLALTPTHRQHGIEALLVKRFGMTMAEAKVANAIAEGLSPREIAQRDALSVHTIRTQLKAAMAKTQSNRQVQLAAKVLALKLNQPSR